MHSQRIIDIRYVGWDSRGSIVFAGMYIVFKDRWRASSHAISTPVATLGLYTL